MICISILYTILQPDLAVSMLLINHEQQFVPEIAVIIKHIDRNKTTPLSLGLSFCGEGGI